MDTVKHTPTPYHESLLGDSIRDDQNRTIAITDGIHWDVSNDTAKANTEFIVRACNNFEELLEACEKAKAIIYELCGTAPKDAEFHHRLDLIENAIAKAEGK